MKIIACMLVRNEAHELGLSARVALKWADELVILDHCSTDCTPEIIEELAADNPDCVTAIREEDPVWHEMQYRQRMLEAARARKATHIAMVDADEILTANLITGDFVQAATRGAMVCLPGYNLRGGLDRYHADGVWGKRWFSVLFRDTPEAHWKGEQLHHREPWGVNWRTEYPVQQKQGGILHLWGANERRIRAKHAHYKMFERLRFPQKSVREIDTQYSQWVMDKRWTFAFAPPEWLAGYEPLMPWLNLDAEPWQEADCKRMMAAYGPERFKGLDLFGVV